MARAKSSLNERHPRITPLRALELLRELDYRQGVRVGSSNGSDSAIDQARAALASHVRNVLARAGSR
jgi:hypothetical protein